MPQSPASSRPERDGERDGSGIGSGSVSIGGNITGDERVDGNGHQVANVTLTPGASLPSRTNSSFESGSFIGSRTGSRLSPFRPPPVDTRQRYKGFPFVFATDAYHRTEIVYGNEIGDCIRYLKPIHRVQRIDSLPPIRTPYFFVGFNWKNAKGHQCSASFMEGTSGNLDPADVAIFRQEFTVWNDLFCELDQTLGRLRQCEIVHFLPRFKASIDLKDLADPNKFTNPKTPLRDLKSTFLCAAREILEKHTKENESPPDHIQEIESKTEGWKPCTGYSVLQATGWDGEGQTTRNDIVTQSDTRSAREVDSIP